MQAFIPSLITQMTSAARFGFVPADKDGVTIAIPLNQCIDPVNCISLFKSQNYIGDVTANYGR
jgi:hypothetical protein